MGNKISMDKIVCCVTGRKPRADAKKAGVTGLFAAEAGV